MGDIFGLTAVILLGLLIDQRDRPIKVVLMSEAPPSRRYVPMTSYNINDINDTVTLPALVARQKAKQ